MPSEIHVHLLPDHFSSKQLRGSIAVMVDVLRASTTILTALSNGAAGVIPCLSVNDALALRTADAAVLLGGERSGVKISDFDLSNSPSDYLRPTVKDRTIGFTTTNGTRALLHSVEADQVLIGAFSNVVCLAQYLITCSQPLHVVCAGTNREITGEDAVFAGCLIDYILSNDQQQVEIELTDTALMTLGWWRFESAKRLLTETLMTTRGGKNLVALSYESDIAVAAELNSCPVLARFEVSSGRITL